jgi:hypothetical protein
MSSGEGLTPDGARALRMAALFGIPTPTPPELKSALAKLRKIATEPEKCGDCDGTGDDRANDEIPCRDCDGNGWIDTGKANPSPPTQPEDIETHKQMFGTAFVYDGHLLDPSKVEVHTAQPVPIQGEGQCSVSSGDTNGEACCERCGGDRKLHTVVQPKVSGFKEPVEYVHDKRPCPRCAYDGSEKGEATYYAKGLNVMERRSDGDKPVIAVAYRSEAEPAAALLNRLQAGASSKDQVVEAAEELLEVRSRIGDFTATEQRERFDKAAANLATALNLNSETEK